MNKLPQVEEYLQRRNAAYRSALRQRGLIINPYSFGAGSSSDPNFASVVLLVDASDEADASTPSTIDVKGKTPTYRGNAQCKTDQHKFGTSSIYFDGSNDRVSFADSADWAMGTGDATWEAWVRPDGDFGALRIWISQATSVGAFFAIQGYRNASQLFYRAVSNGTTTYSGTGLTITKDVWSHLAIVRHGANLWGFINGVGELTSTALSGVTLLDSASAMTFGAYADVDNVNYHWKGWMDQMRITKGVARYTSSPFTPSAAKWPHS